MIEEIFISSGKKNLPTVDKITDMDFFIDELPFDLKVTIFPKELMSESIADELNERYGSKRELVCSKKVAQ